MQKPPFGGFAPRAAATGVVCDECSRQAVRRQYQRPVELESVAGVP